MKKILLLAFILIFATSCKTKQKAVERHDETVKIETKEVVKETEAKGVSVDSISTKKSETLTVKKDETIELTQADENKTITITDETGKSLTIKGANAKISTKKETIQTKDSSAVSITKIDTTTTTKDNTKKVSIDSDKKGRSTQVETKGFGIPWWIFLILGLGILVYLYIKKKLPFF